MSKPASRSLRSWLKNGNSENSPPNTPKSERSSVAEKDKKTTPTHSTPGKRVTRRNSQLDGVSTPVKTPLRNTRRASISENDNKSVAASPLRRSVRRLSATLEDASAPAAVKSRRKSVIIIDSPIKEESENTAVSTSPPRKGRGRPRLVKEIKKSDRIEQVTNDVKTKEKTDKRSKSKPKSVSPMSESLIIVIDDDDDEVDAVGVIKKNNIQVDDNIKVDNIKEKVEEKETTLVISKLVGKKEDDKKQSLDDCTPKNDGKDVIEKNITGTNTVTGTVKVAEINDEDADKVIFEKEDDDSMEAIVIREDVNEAEDDENNEKLVEHAKENGGKPQPPSSDEQEENGEQRKLKSQKDLVKIITDDIELNTNIQDVSGRNNYNEAGTSVNAAEKRNMKEKEEISDRMVETINNSIELFFEELKEQEMVFENEEDDNMEGIVIRKDVSEKKDDEKIVEESESISKKEENRGKSHPPSSDKQEETAEQRKLKSQKNLVEIIADDIDLNTNNLIKDVSEENNYNEADIRVNAAEIINISEKEEINDSIVDTVNKSSHLSYTEQKGHEIITRDEKSRNDRGAEHGRDEVIFKKEDDDSMEAIVIREEESDENNEKLVEESMNINKKGENGGQPQPLSSDEQEENGEQRKLQPQKDLVKIISDDIELNTNIQGVNGRNNYNEANTSVIAAEIINISEKEEINDSIVETVNKSSQLSFTKQKEREIITSCDEKRDCSSLNENNDTVAEHDHDEGIFKTEEDDSMEAIVIREDVNEKESDENNKKLVADSESINKKEENGEKPHSPSSDEQEENAEQRKLKSQKDLVEVISDDIELNTNIQDVSGRNNFNEAGISDKAVEIRNISEKAEITDSIVQTANKSSQLSFTEQKEHEIITISRDEKRDCSSLNENNGSVAEHDHDEENDNMEAIVINKDVNEKEDDENYEQLVEQSESSSKKEGNGKKSQSSSSSDKQEDDENYEKLVEESESSSKKEENVRKSQSPSSSDKQEETEEQRQFKSQKDMEEIISDDIELNTINSIKDVTGENNYKEVDISVNPPEIINISETEEINNSIVETVNNSSQFTITCNEKGVDSINTTKNNNEKTNGFEQSKNQNKSLKILEGNYESISNEEEESEINITNESCIKMKVRNDKSKIHKSVTFDDNSEKQLSIKYPTTPLAKGKIYSDSFMGTLRNIDSSYETSVNCNNTSGSFKESEENEISQKMSIDVQNCDTTSDCDTPYKNLSKKIKMSSSTPIFKQIFMQKDDVLNHVNKSNEDLIMKENVEGSLGTNKAESFSNLVNANQKNNTHDDLLTNTLNEKELTNTECLLSQSCNKIETVNVSDNTNKIEADNTQNALSIFVSSGSESGNYHENNREKEKNLEGAEKNTLLCNNRKSNLEIMENLTQNEIVKEPIIRNDEDQELTSNLELGKDVNASRENSTYFKNNDFNNDTPVLNVEKDKTINLERESRDHQRLLLTTDNIPPKMITKDISEYLNNSENDNEGIHNITENLQDDKETNTSNKGTANICQNSAENMNSKFQSSEGVSINNDSKQNHETSKYPEYSNISSECEETEEILNTLKQAENSDIQMDKLSEVNNEIETEKKSTAIFNNIVEDKDQEVLLENCTDTSLKNNLSLLHKSPEKQNDFEDSHIQKQLLKDSKIINELLITETSDIVDCNLEDKELPTSNKKPGSRKSLSRRSTDNSFTSIKSNNLNSSLGDSIQNGDFDRASPKIKNKSFDSSRKTMLLNESNLSLPFTGFDENNITTTELNVLKLLEDNKSNRRSSSPTHSLNETFTSVHHLDYINECSSNEENENVSNKEISNKSTTLQTKEPELEVLEEIKMQSATASFLELKDASSENMNKTGNSENDIEKLIKCSNDDSKRLSDLDTNSNKITTSNMKAISENTSNKVSQKTKSENTIKGANSAKKYSKQQTKVKMAETESKATSNQENTSPISRERKLKRKLVTEVVKQNSTKVKKIKEDVIQSIASHKNMEKKSNKSNELPTSNKKQGNKKSLTPIKSINLDITINCDFDRASPKIKNKDLINNKTGQEPEQGINMQENNRENNNSIKKTKKDSPIKNKSFDSSRKTKLYINESNLSLPFAGFDENNITNIEFDMLKLLEENKSSRRSSSPTHSQNSTKAKKIKEDVIQSSASHKNMEKKLNKSNAKENVQTGKVQSSLCQKHIAKENEKKLKTNMMNVSKKQKDRLLPDDILEAIDTSHKKSKKPHVYDSEGSKKSKTELQSESSNKKKTSRYATSGGISDIIKNPSGIFFEEPITPEKKHPSKSFKNGKRKILSTIELPTGVVYEEPVTPDHKKIVNGFKETTATPKAIGFKVKSILSAGQKEPPVYKKETQKRRKLILDEPTTVLPKPKWATSGAFTVTKYPKAINLDESIATEFLVTPLQPKRSRMEAGVAPLATTAAYEFKKGALYNKQIPRETSKQLLQRKEKQKYYMF